MPFTQGVAWGRSADKIHGPKDFENWKQKKNSKKGKKIQERIKSKKTRKKALYLEHNKIAELKESYKQIKSFENFDEYPLSDETIQGLKSNGYVKPTSIQKASLAPALQGKDILGAAKTGSGKTLAFIIPILECLYLHQWSCIDGPGALLITPTRELAYQIFEVLQKVGCRHTFSAGLVIGGKNIAEEASRIQNTNIVVCTPGRLLQHLNSTSYFRLDNLKLLVLDEADQILDMGFAATINAVIENLPETRQTLLYSATQTQSVKDLARLSLQNPVYVSVHAEATHSTPVGLKQRFLVCQLHDKLDVLYSFVRNHLKSKTLVFFSSCKEVQYYFSIFCRLRPGISVMHIHGRMNQQRRLSVYQQFSCKKFALLFSTDLAARGLDFPNIDWVVQVDCPEDSCSYIHRVGRTARFHGGGNALLMLLPSEKEGMLEEFNKMKVPITETSINNGKTTSLNNKVQSFCAEDKELKEKAQRTSPHESTSGADWLQDEDAATELFIIKPDNSTDEISSTLPNELPNPISSRSNTRTKVAEAKRLIRKGMKVNQQIKFNNEEDGGEELTESDEDHDGGINISTAKLNMMKRDIKDRLKHKKQVQLKHKEARNLAKENRRQLQSQKTTEREETVVLFGNSNDGDVEDGDGCSYSSDEMDSHPFKKQRHEIMESEGSMGLDLADEESLALCLINKT